LETAAQALLARAGLEGKPFYGAFIRWKAEPGHPFQMPEGEKPDILTQSGQLYGEPLAVGGLFLMVFNPFPIGAVRSARLWLYLRYLMELMPGEMEISPEIRFEDEVPQTLNALQPMSDWWNTVALMEPAQARAHRKSLQTSLKKNQFNALPGYVSRMVNTRTLSVGEAWACVPLLMEAVWAQYPQMPLKALLQGLDGREMGVHPDTALIAWASQVSQMIKEEAGRHAAAPIERVVAGILADCSLPYSQTNLARSLGLTPTYFCRLFREETGSHFSEFLTRVRMEKAKELLGEPGEMNLALTAQKCGYPHKSYFCQVFKKYTGMSPGEYHLRQSK